MRIRSVMRIIGIILILSAATAALTAGGVTETSLEPIRLGVLPDADSLPFLVAEYESLFETYGADVELVSFHSPVERDAAFQAGEIDGFIGDTLAALFMEEAGIDITITSDTKGRYGIAASPDSSIREPKDLIGKTNGISSNTIIEYAVYALLEDQGVPTDNLRLTAVPKIPIRMELLLQGGLDAATLPEPLYSLVIARGARPIIDTTILPSAPGILIFSADVVQTKRANMEALYSAYAEAASRIDANPDGYRDFLIDHAGFPAPVRDAYEFVTYGTPRLPADQEISAVADWMAGKGLIGPRSDFSDLFDPDWELEFLQP